MRGDITIPNRLIHFSQTSNTIPRWESLVPNPHLLLFIFFAIFLLLPTASAIPQIITVQGKLTNSTGHAQNGTFSLNFSIFSAETGGTSLWTEVQNIKVTDGIFDVYLGNNTALNIPFDRQYYLETKVGGEILSPRIRIASSGYAFRANVTDNVEKLIVGGNVTPSANNTYSVSYTHLTLPTTPYV